MTGLLLHIYKEITKSFLKNKPDNSVLECQRKEPTDVTRKFCGNTEASFYLGTFSSFSLWALDGLSRPLVTYAETEISELSSSPPKLSSSCWQWRTGAFGKGQLPYTKAIPTKGSSPNLRQRLFQSKKRDFFVFLWYLFLSYRFL